jgi:signal peptidase I
MAKGKQPFKIPEAPGKPSARTVQAAVKPQSHAFRETVESIVIAFVLAFLFRTFEAEAFVIPTGSMAPTLMGRHKDVDCPKCRYRYEVSASEEESEDGSRPTTDVIAGMCPMCRYVMPMVKNLPDDVQERHAEKIQNQPSYNGDRILVNKYLYAFTDPKRWDVVVFKFPGDAKVNYIKRLVGLPGETLRIEHGNIFIKPAGAADAEFKIERKPADKVLAMRQLVHDTKYDPAELDAAGWPLRWHAQPSEANPWQVAKSTVGNNVQQTYSVDAKGDATSWLRYEHLVPTYEAWQQVQNANTPPNAFSKTDRSKLRRLITDSNPYNGRVDRAFHMAGTLQVAPNKEGLHWVSDLIVEADVDVESAGGELLLDLVKGGQHFTCSIDLKTGEAKLSAPNAADLAQAKTAVVGAGKHHVAFGNVDEQLLLWVDGKSIDFGGKATYDAKAIFGSRDSVLPKTSDQDPGDLAPAGIGARDAKVTVTRLQVWRDLYYIADSWDRSAPGEPVNDFVRFDHAINYSLASNPAEWKRYAERQKAEFPLNNDQLFVMGDNSAESSDARLWLSGGRGGTHPGGAYLDRRLLIGKALCVYWPHSWNQIPGTPIPFPLFPNFADMRLVR